MTRSRSAKYLFVEKKNRCSLHAISRRGFCAHCEVSGGALPSYHRAQLDEVAHDAELVGVADGVLIIMPLPDALVGDEPDPRFKILNDVAQRSFANPISSRRAIGLAQSARKGGVLKRRLMVPPYGRY